jgi:hypothetical protein
MSLLSVRAPMVWLGCLFTEQINIKISACIFEKIFLIVMTKSLSEGSGGKGGCVHRESKTEVPLWGEESILGTESGSE